jgi:hypothetical protein
MSDTLPSDGIEVLSGVGHLNAYDHDGTYLWTAKMDGVAFYYGSAQEFITEGSNSPAVQVKVLSSCLSFDDYQQNLKSL